MTGSYGLIAELWASLSPSVFLLRSQDAVACLVSDFYPKELHVSLASPRASVLAQALTVAPIAHETYSAIHIGRAGENDPVTCSVYHLGKETIVSYQPGMSSSFLRMGGSGTKKGYLVLWKCFLDH